ncbi:hypothetical protein BpHYR1_051617 [Brachionus plicatilis]|uniref:Uncharacterized protein n=1 Tax=Brachionus plicatilis TaxID=10195 RepID=A0A3M7QZP9_BRAPC|nr:hypothetical protein BpHYR1_051617 [Brachionus plicatilis]
MVGNKWHIINGEDKLPCISIFNVFLKTYSSVFTLKKLNPPKIYLFKIIQYFIIVYLTQICTETLRNKLFISILADLNMETSYIII